MNELRLNCCPQPVPLKGAVQCYSTTRERLPNLGECRGRDSQHRQAQQTSAGGRPVRLQEAPGDPEFRPARRILHRRWCWCGQRAPGLRHASLPTPPHLPCASRPPQPLPSAGIILDNFCRGRTRHVWLSSSADLHADATRDLRDLGMQIPVINNCSALDAATKVGGLSQDFKEGVLFLTYSTLVSAGRGGRSRFQQVLDWVGGDGFDGCLVFDECHRWASSCSCARLPARASWA